MRSLFSDERRDDAAAAVDLDLHPPARPLAMEERGRPGARGDLGSAELVGGVRGRGAREEREEDESDEDGEAQGNGHADGAREHSLKSYKGARPISTPQAELLTNPVGSPAAPRALVLRAALEGADVAARPLRALDAALVPRGRALRLRDRVQRGAARSGARSSASRRRSTRRRPSRAMRFSLSVETFANVQPDVEPIRL